VNAWDVSRFAARRIHSNSTRASPLLVAQAFGAPSSGRLNAKLVVAVE